jgi:hypothetical protein
MKTKIAIGSKLCKMALGGGHGHGRRRSGRRRPWPAAVRRATARGWQRACHARPRVGWGVAPVAGGVKMAAAASGGGAVAVPARPDAGRRRGEAGEVQRVVAHMGLPSAASLDGREGPAACGR